MNVAMKPTHDNKVIHHSVGMMVALISFAMLFATLFLGLTLYRFSATYWPPAGIEQIPLTVPLISSLIALLSSAFYFLFEKSLDKENKENSIRYFVISALLGFGFLYSQFSLWSVLKDHSIFASTGVFGSLIYTFTWIHAAHIVLCYLLFAWVFIRLVDEDKLVNLKQLAINTGKCWHFLAIIWFVIFILLFVI